MAACVFQGLHAETAFLKEAFVFACIGGHPNVVKLFLSHGIKFDLGLIRYPLPTTPARTRTRTHTHTAPHTQRT
jgi:hypothetical protein